MSSHTLREQFNVITPKFRVGAPCFFYLLLAVTKAMSGCTPTTMKQKKHGTEQKNEFKYVDTKEDPTDTSRSKV